LTLRWGLEASRRRWRGRRVCELALLISRDHSARMENGDILAGQLVYFVIHTRTHTHALHVVRDKGVVGKVCFVAFALWTRGLHSSPTRLNASTFCGIRWLASVCKRATKRNGSG